MHVFFASSIIFSPSSVGLPFLSHGTNTFVLRESFIHFHPSFSRFFSRFRSFSTSFIAASVTRSVLDTQLFIVDAMILFLFFCQFTYRIVRHVRLERYDVKPLLCVLAYDACRPHGLAVLRNPNTACKVTTSFSFARISGAIILIFVSIIIIFW